MESQNKASLYFFVAVMTFFLFLTVKMILPYVTAILMGGILAVLSKPLYRQLLARKLKPTIAATLITLGIVILVIGPLLTFVTQAVKQAVVLGEWFANSETFSTTFRAVLEKLAAWSPMELVIDDAKDLEHSLRELLQHASTLATEVLVELAKGIPNAVLQMFLAALACFFFLVDGRRLFVWLAAKLPIDAEIKGKITGSFRDTAISVVWASMAAAGTQALIMLIAFSALRVPAASLAAGATFIFAWIPLLGSGPVWLAGAAYLLFNGMQGKAIAMVVIGIFTSLVDNFVRPLVLRGRGEMHPLVSLVAIFGGIQMFGLFGVFFGPILAATVITLLTVWPIVGRRNGLPLPE
jgi:predicted PurR-regulated permease PerM